MKKVLRLGCEENIAMITLRTTMMRSPRNVSLLVTLTGMMTGNGILKILNPLISTVIMLTSSVSTSNVAIKRKNGRNGNVRTSIFSFIESLLLVVVEYYDLI